MSDPRKLSPEAKQLVDQYIHSVDELRCLVALQAGGTRVWSAADVSSELDLNEPVALEALEQLVVKGFAHVVWAGARRYVYLPRSHELRTHATELARLYTEFPAELLSEVSSEALARVRFSASQLSQVIHEKKKGRPFS